MKLKSLFVLVGITFVLNSCNRAPHTDPVKKEQEVLAAPNKVVDYEIDGIIYKDSSKINRQPFIDWVLEDTATLSYPFTASIQKKYVTIATSPDGKLRIYSWDTREGGTMTCWGNIIQYRDGKKVKAYNRSLYAVVHPEDYDSNEWDYGSFVRQIQTVFTSKGEAIYLVNNYFRESSNIGYTSIMAFRIQNGKLVEAPCFDVNGERTNEIGVEHGIADWYFITNLGDGWNWLYQYDTKNQDLYTPTTVNEFQSLTDQYDIYHFDGEKFTYTKKSGPFWLYPELRTFDKLYLLFETENYIIRIDQMEEDVLRYASWKRGTPMSEKPDIVLTGEKRIGEGCVFTNGSFRYIIHEGYNNALELKKNGKTILYEEQKDNE